jgi:hypothetical protein
MAIQPFNRFNVFIIFLLLHLCTLLCIARAFEVHYNIVFSCAMKSIDTLHYYFYSSSFTYFAMHCKNFQSVLNFSAL